MISFTQTLLALAIFSTAQASIYVTFPAQGDKCAVGQPCQIKWTDDSKAPPTSALGETSIDLVTGNASNLQPIQNLGGVSNPSVATALTFTPISGLSPTQQYAIRFLSKANTSNPIFSTYFTITGGSGTAKPLTTSNSSTGSAGSPAPIIGSKAPNASTSGNTTAQSSTSSANNQTAAANASKSAASSIVAPFYVMAVMTSLCALFEVL